MPANILNLPQYAAEHIDAAREDLEGESQVAIARM